MTQSYEKQQENFHPEGNEALSPVANGARLDAVQTIQDWLVLKFSEVLSIDPKQVDVKEPLANYGLGSIQTVALVGDLEEWLGCVFPPTLLWDYPTIAGVSSYLAEAVSDQVPPVKDVAR